MKRISSRKKANGQVLLTFVFFVIVLVCFVGFVIDIGFAYVTRSKLSKAVDAASLAGVRYLFQGGKDPVKIAKAAFGANYGRPGRDVGDVNPTVNTTHDDKGNLVITVDATANINTFFIRVLPGWKTLSVSAHAQATRQRVVLGLVLDRSQSMRGNRGAEYLPGAVSDFVDNWIEDYDRACMSSFSTVARLDVAMTNFFKTPVKTAANNLKFDWWTASEQGLSNGWAQVSNVPSQNVVRAVVFFTDGLANTWQYNFVCGGVTNTLNISPDTDLWDPNIDSDTPYDSHYSSPRKCTISAFMPSITSGFVDISDDIQNQCPSDPDRRKGLYLEAQRRAENIARQIREEGIYVYSIGLADPTRAQECGYTPLNIPFLENIANTTNSATYNPRRPVGAVAIAPNAESLRAAFQQIADTIQFRLTQ